MDSHDNIWVYHRPRTLDASSAGAMPRVATNEQRVPISALGHPRPYADQSTGCCVPAPSVLKFDREGNLLAAWGGPSDPGFLESNCREADGCFWPAREHGIFVDQNDFVYVVGQRRGRWRPSTTGRGNLSVGTVLRRRFARTQVQRGWQVRLPDRQCRIRRAEQRKNRRRSQRYAAAVPSGGYERRPEDEPPIHRGRLRQSTHPDRGCRDGPIHRPLRCVRTEPGRRRSELGRGRYRCWPVDSRLSGRQHETDVLPQPVALRHREPRRIPVRLRSWQQPRPNLPIRKWRNWANRARTRAQSGQVRLRA